MWAYIIRRIVYNIPVYLAIVFIVMALLRVKDPIAGQLGKNATEEAYQELRIQRGLHEPFLVQYFKQLKSIVTLNFERQLWSSKFSVTIDLSCLKYWTRNGSCNPR